jgi:hypothetical protein
MRVRGMRLAGQQGTAVLLLGGAVLLECIRGIPEQMRTVLALRFLAVSGFDVCLAAENIQMGLEQVLGDDDMLEKY